MSNLLVTDIPQIDANDMILCKNAAEYLSKAFPGYQWAVSTVDGLVRIFNLDLSGEYGYTLNGIFYSASEWKKRVIEAGGEVLERFGQRTGMVDVARLESAPMRLGKLVGELH